MDSVKLQAYGKINLSLDVLKQRADGYHDVRMIMQTVKLHDNIDMQKTREPGIKLSTNLSFLPVNENNLMYRAARMLLDEFDIKEGVSMHLKKVIPVSAGMAGGSTDAASVLYGMNKLFNLGLSSDDLKKRGVKLGADIPFCLMRGTALSEGIGEILTPLPKLPPCPIVLAKPGISVSTKFVYQNLHVNDLPESSHPDVDSVIEALKKHDVREIAENMGNILESVTCKHYPEIEDIKTVMKDLGAVNAIMSGSGPTVFGIFDDARMAKKCYESLRFGKHKHLAKQIYLTEPWR
ncbi:4-(cytidine 5'-diphospho)-2-C-methyl-D-erythritol kinase [Oribacterium sp. P6A1]|uniref:4-(cytidine 5'-diphospho)-2-C-methyl-D-erythritol kinase n=1 Tax=Oribacterium sp. P6A1 TaxID=1410612 RepID=UPI0005692023|nr:4-(cytidine 5'-diphospho)-2-C-methyl-D-erythritol kinase [Oribacterium sp. P6A1]